MILLSSADFCKIDFLQRSLSGTLLRGSNGFDPDQDRRADGPDLGPNRLQRL